MAKTSSYMRTYRMKKSASGGSGVFEKVASPVHLKNEKHMSSGGRWKHTILEASDAGSGGISLDYATAKSYEHPNRNTTVAKYELEHGVWSSQTGNQSPGSVGINWDNVKFVSGRTFDVKGLLNEKGFRWNRDTRRYERA